MKAHLKGKDDGLVYVRQLLEMATNWRRLLTSAVNEEELREFREHDRTGRVLGSEEFQQRLERQLGRVLRRQKPRPKKTPKRSLRMVSPELPGTPFPRNSLPR